MKFFIPYRLPGLNDMIAEAKVRIARGSLYDLNKRKHTQRISNIIGKHKKPMGKVFINFFWQEPSKRRDPDNLAAGRKFILDALVWSGLLAGDGWRYIEGWTDTFTVNKENPGVLVQLTEISGGGKNEKSAFNNFNADCKLEPCNGRGSTG